jgi:dephospho-CoA kinase
MLKVGITGGIGSGKSTVCKVFGQLGIAVYDADARGKAILVENEGLKKKVVEAFGAVAYNENGSLNRKFLSERVFSSTEAMDTLNGLVHPEVRLDFERWIGEQKSAYVIKEAAILIESGAYKGVDEIIVVSASEETRIRRVMKRDQVDEGKVRERMSAQLSDEQRESYADHTIDNNDDQLVIPQILQIHEDINSRANS